MDRNPKVPVVLRWPVLSARNEFEAARALAAVGVSVPEPIAFAVRGLNPASLDSFVLSQAIEPSISLEDLVAKWDREPPSLGERRALITAVGDIVRRMHRAGINHRDLYICHFLLRDESTVQQTAKPPLTLIDLHRAQVRASVPTRWLIKDLGALLFSVLNVPLSERDLLRFLQAYSAHGRDRAADSAQFRLQLLDPERQAFWGLVRRRAMRLYEEALRKKLVTGAPRILLDD